MTEPDGTYFPYVYWWREMRAWESFGHGGSCFCKPCDRLRIACFGFIGIVENYPLRYGINGDFCQHAVHVIDDTCLDCVELWRSGTKPNSERF